MSLANVMKKPVNGWAKVLTVVIPLAAVGAVSLIRTVERVDALKADVAKAATAQAVAVQQAEVDQQLAGLKGALEGKANRETIMTQYAAILRELEAVNRRLERLENRGRP